MFKEKLSRAIVHYRQTKDLSAICQVLREMIVYIQQNSRLGFELSFTDSLPEMITMLHTLHEKRSNRKSRK